MVSGKYQEVDLHLLEILIVVVPAISVSSNATVAASQECRYNAKSNRGSRRWISGVENNPHNFPVQQKSHRGRSDRGNTWRQAHIDHNVIFRMLYLEYGLSVRRNHWCLLVVV